MDKEERIHAYLDGELSGEARRTFEAEIAADAGLQARVEELRALFTQLNSLEDASLDRELKTEVLQSIQAQPADMRQPTWPLLAQALSSLAITALAWSFFADSLPALPDPAAGLANLLLRAQDFIIQAQSGLFALQAPPLTRISLPSLNISTSNLILLSGSVLLLSLVGNGLLLRGGLRPTTKR